MNRLIETALQPAISVQSSLSFLALAQLHPQQGEQPLGSAPILLGRDHGCQVVVDDPSVSRVHARLEEQGGKLWLQDLESRNGCAVNRRRLQGEPVPVALGDILRLGEVVLRLVSRPRDCAPPPQASPLVGGPALHETLRLIRVLGPADLRVLVRGESGTGKELVARELHLASGRSGPFIAVNCAAIPEPLVESELFGHVRGAFTGSVKDKPGLFEAAAGGTLFLDELTELPASVQPKLLRVLESRELRRVGALQSVSVDCRIIGATNRDLQRELELGRFRPDLAARLAEVEILTPRLASRVEDLPILIQHLARRAGHQVRLDASAIEALACYDWPLNVRELDNLVRTLAVLAAGQVVTASMLPAQILSQPVARREEHSPADRVLEALRKNGGNVRQTAQELAVSRTFIYRCLDRSGLSPAMLRGTERACGGGKKPSGGAVR